LLIVVRMTSKFCKKTCRLPIIIILSKSKKRLRMYRNLYKKYPSDGSLISQSMGCSQFLFLLRVFSQRSVLPPRTTALACLDRETFVSIDKLVHDPAATPAPCSHGIPRDRELYLCSNVLFYRSYVYTLEPTLGYIQRSKQTEPVCLTDFTCAS